MSTILKTIETNRLSIQRSLLKKFDLQHMNKTRKQ